MEQAPGGNSLNIIEKQILDIKKDIAEIEALEYETRYPELITRPYDTGLPGEQYKAWQALKALKTMRKKLATLEGQLK